MLALKRLVVCSICGGELEEGEGGRLACSGCERSYRLEGEVYRMIPDTPPDDLAGVWTRWEEVQHNGEVAYHAAPELNLALAAGPTVDAFVEWNPMDGQVLDVGCGPNAAMPAYVRHLDPDEYLGLDPLRGSDDREFPHVQGIAEYLPLRGESFDHVILFSSLDHLLDYRRALVEAYRVLVPGGRIHIVADCSPASGVVHLLSRGVRQVARGVREMGPRRTLSYLGQLRVLKIPRGAVDCFHVEFPRPAQIADALERAGFHDVRFRGVGSEVLIKAERTGSRCAG